MPYFAPAALVLTLGLPPIAVVTTPGGGACPAAAALGAALAHVGAQAPAAPGAAWTLVVEEGEPVVLRDPRGATALAREIPREDDPSCEALAQVIALVVERYFRDVAWTAGTPAPGLAATVAEVRATPRPPADAGAPPAGATGATARRLPPRLELSAGPLVWSRDPSPRATLELRGRIAGVVSWAAAGVVPPPRLTETLPGGGALHLSAWPMLLRVAAELGDARVAWRFGLDGLLTFEHAEAGRGFDDPGERWRAVLSAGGAAGVAVALAARLRLVIEAGAYRAALGRSFVVRGAAENGGGGVRVLEPPAWQGLAAARLAWVISP